MIELLNIDCMEYMATCKDKQFDLAIVDPQFGIGNFIQVSGNIRGNKVNWNERPPSKRYFIELYRVSKNRIIFGANYFNCFDKNGGAIIWLKNQPMPNFSKAVIASCSFHKKIEIYKQTWTNFVQKDRTGIHPCEMPLDLYKWLLKNYAKPDMKIIDTHLGSGSSAIAAYDFGCDFVGCEIDKDYYDAAVKRFETHKMQQTITWR